MKLELSLKQKKQDLDKLATQDLPDLMQELNLKNFTLNNGAKVLVDDVLSGSIPSASSILRAKGEDKMEKEMRQEQCFDWLRANGGSDLIKSNVEVQFGRDEDQLCNDFTKELQDKIYTLQEEQVGVHPATLNSFLKEKIESGKMFLEIPLNCLKVAKPR